jgi:hypothetical protein
MKTILFFLLLFFFAITSKAQSTSSEINSVDGIVNKIIKNDFTEEQKVTAIFSWVTDNIAYDIDNMFNINFYEKPQLTIERTIRTKKGVCQHYAYLFDTLCKSVGIQSYVISGFTKQKKYADFIPHAWCVAKINDIWKLYDPTWSAGYIDNSTNKFVKQFNKDYFETLPQKFLQNHIPFDCIWQLMEYPISYNDFVNGKFNSTSISMNFNDSIQQFFRQNELEQNQGMLRRIENNGVANQLVFDRVNHLKNNVQNIVATNYMNNFNGAVNEFNEAIKFDNEYINFYNTQFTPKKADTLIEQMLTVVDRHNRKAEILLEHLGKQPDGFVGSNPSSIKEQIDDLQKKLEGQKEFVKKYIGTSKLFRKTLFYKYTIYGIPVN